MSAAWLKTLNAELSPELPILIAGPTASGKTALALELASKQGGIIINADALQVFNNWRVLTARPTPEEESQAPHYLYGHVAKDFAYSVGHWLRDVKPLLEQARPIIIGGTGLYFKALTEGLADIPATPPKVRAEADARLSDDGIKALLAEIDPETLLTLDTLNPMRVQRAWEVQRTTGRGLAFWQSQTPAPAMPLENAQPVLLNADRDWLNDRIGRRFDLMIAKGALEEARQNLPDWNPAWPSAKAIGASPLISHLKGECDLRDAVDASKTLTRQYAKRQRTWFRSKMQSWRAILLS